MPATNNNILRVKINGVWTTVPAIQGPQGPAPVKGVDYWTAQDQADIVNDVLDALNDADTTQY